ncbi:hypothetical protein QZM35_23165 [Burkholderia sp. AU45274]|uniref:hypothetical protein n=1 Tax=Burkholderia sp. AU45274 TaxID=3059205 RepID=UPI00264BC9F4|nr:hypothetical protein [Burkholderia sp. AU45274]MDN7490616.1 hypothetical protein [Burkholderia sp. AU45274]
MVDYVRLLEQLLGPQNEKWLWPRTLTEDEIEYFRVQARAPEITGGVIIRGNVILVTDGVATAFTINWRVI